MVENYVKLPESMLCIFQKRFVASVYSYTPENGHGI